SKRWLLQQVKNEDSVKRLMQEINVDEKIAYMLVLRGVTNFDEAKKFFRPSLDDLHNPFLMKGMDAAVERLSKAIQQKEKILVYGDYDVDGTTAVSLMYSFLTSFYPNVSYYIPDRYVEGYGISFKGIDFASDNNFSLIISLDCGIRSVDKIDYANKKNIDFIICDHHLPSDAIPDAVAVLDPKQKDCNYPYKELTGCGVGYKLIQAYCLMNNIPIENTYQFLDLLAISCAADIVPITGENRVFTFYGLQQVNEKPRPGIKALLEQSNVKKNLTVSDLVFIIGPRINAAGRIQSGMNAVELLTSSDIDKASETALLINKNNLERKELDLQITNEALQIIEENSVLQQRKTTVLYSEQWHKGVIGIVASRLIEKYYRPTILLTASNGKATGSARSVKDFDVHAAIEACSDLLEQFGGHKYAAGLTLPIENVEKFIERFEHVVSSSIHDDMLIPAIEIDTYINFSDISPKFYRLIKQFAPFGPGNLSPMLATKNVLVKQETLRIVGNNHLKATVYQPENPTLAIDMIAFNLGAWFDYVYSGKAIDICYHIEENEWNGNVSLQLNVKDIKASN
ncbi:MAG: single-stranded-DNA-specific exonuclease RecJ, partial [Bacteroidia bacterium]